MSTRFLASLRFQVSMAFGLLLLLYTAASLYSLGSFERQLAYASVVDIAGRLELAAQHLYTQAMNYEKNAPRDYKTYYRDVRLYYRDLMSHMATIDQVVEEFMHGRLPAAATGARGAAGLWVRLGALWGDDTDGEGDRGGHSDPSRTRGEGPRADAADGIGGTGDSDGDGGAAPRPNRHTKGDLETRFSADVDAAIRALEATWKDYRAGLLAALGPDPAEPRLEYAAQHNIAHHAALEQATETLTASLRVFADTEHRKIVRVSVLLVVVGSLVTVLILAILDAKTLAPLRRTIDGIRRVADGDFGHRIRVGGTSEVRHLTESFNGLSGCLDVLFALIERLARGNDLDEVIGFLSREFPALLHIDWVGVVLLTRDRSRARLEVSYLDGESERLSKPLFRLQGTLLERALAEGRPLHVTDMEATAAANPAYQFLRSLVERGLEDAIFLPLTPQTLTPIPAVLVFATRTRGSYDDAHLRFLDNIAQLITHSFGRTVRLAEHARLAAIGELASGIAHELRTPMNTLLLALEYFERLGLDERAAKRLRLARQEAARMQRLLADILLYAKPTDLVLRPLDLTAHLARFVDDHQALPSARRQHIVIERREPIAPIMADPDRLTQILLNLTQNACEAAPEGSQITWVLDTDAESGGVSLEIANFGDPIPPELLPRVTEPFLSTKPAGTGLGLAIVHRLTLDHGGELSVRSDASEGTRVRILFPRGPVGEKPGDVPGEPGLPPSCTITI